MRVTVFRRVTISAAMAVAVALPATAAAATVNVNPGPHALQKGINHAGNGDTLRIADGRYHESVEVTKKLTLQGVGGRPVVDAGCDDDITVDVQHRGVELRHLRVQGAQEGPGPGYTINFIGIDTGTVKDSVVKETCDGEDSAEYGVNIFASGKLHIEGNHTFGGYSDAGIYVGGIDDTLGDSLSVDDNEANGNNRGIIIEDSFDSDVDIQVIDNSTHDNTRGGEGTPSGIFVHNSDHGTYLGNTADDNGDYGIHIDAPSDDNVFTSNQAGGNGVSDLFNEGTGNCAGGANSFGTTSGNPLGPC